MEREEFLEFVRSFQLSEILCGDTTPTLIEFDYATSYSYDFNRYVKIPGDTFIIMFDSINFFSINIPKIMKNAEFKYSFEDKNKKQVKQLLKFTSLKIQNNENTINGSSSCLKFISGYEDIKEIMIALKK